MERRIKSQFFNVSIFRILQERVRNFYIIIKLVKCIIVIKYREYCPKTKSINLLLSIYYISFQNDLLRLQCTSDNDFSTPQNMPQCLCETFQALWWIYFSCLNRLKTMITKPQFFNLGKKIVARCHIICMHNLWSRMCWIFCQKVTNSNGTGRGRIIVVQNLWMISPQFWLFLTNSAYKRRKNTQIIYFIDSLASL